MNKDTTKNLKDFYKKHITGFACFLGSFLLISLELIISFIERGC